MKKNSTLFDEQKKRAQGILEMEVRPQVEIYETIKKSSSNNVKLSPAQKVRTSCTNQL